MMVLIVDRSILVFKRIEEMISGAESIKTIHSAVSYEEANKLVKENNYAAVLLDIDLPENGSIRLLKEIKKTDGKPFIIILSTHIDYSLEKKFKSIGADFFFDKYNDFKIIRWIIDFIGRPEEKTASTSSEIAPTEVINGKVTQQDLTTDIFKNLGLCEAIVNFARDTMEVNLVNVFLELTGFREHSVNNKFKLNVFKIVQEQLNYILKHANATEVTIRLSQFNKSVVLAISDNGVGFDTRQKQKKTGLASIKKKAASYHGTADIVSQPGGGCILAVTFLLTDTQ